MTSRSEQLFPPAFGGPGSLVVVVSPPLSASISEDAVRCRDGRLEILPLRAARQPWSAFEMLEAHVGTWDASGAIVDARRWVEPKRLHPRFGEPRARVDPPSLRALVALRSTGARVLLLAQSTAARVVALDAGCDAPRARLFEWPQIAVEWLTLNRGGRR